MLKKIVIIFLLITSTCFALAKTDIKTQMSNKIDKVLFILHNSNFPKEKKGEEIIKIMNPIFDYSLMSRLTLGKAWKKISKEQRTKFIQLFKEKLKASYIEKLDLYTDQEVKIIGLEETKKNRLKLKTQLIGKSENFDINYKFYTKKNQNNWLIYDVDLIGVSIIKTYKAQFKGFLKNKSFNELLVNLKIQKQ
ncbi:MAG: ABC transporter substrate-binding protein [Arcobacter sp.]|nr:ABC transporter substrate-binding protein [Arcobacter sp.]